MALSLRLWRRQRRIAPMSMPPLRRDAAAAVRDIRDPNDPRSDDYLVEGSELADQPSATAQIVQLLQVILIFVIAVLSFAVFWLLGVLFNVL